MNCPHPTRPRAVLALAALALLGACAQTPVERPRSVSAPVDFSGSWERNYALSDNFQEKLNFVYFDLRRLAQRPGDAQVAVQQGSVNALLALAQLAEEITRTATLEIDQSPTTLYVDRDDDFALICNFNENNLVLQQYAYGDEICGWDADRMVFHVRLPDGLTIQHRMTLSPDRLQLNITTILSSRHSPTPFTLSTYYDRYAAPRDQYDCTLTLTRRRVCSQGGSSGLP